MARRGPGTRGLEPRPARAPPVRVPSTRAPSIRRWPRSGTHGPTPLALSNSRDARGGAARVIADAAARLRRHRRCAAPERAAACRRAGPPPRPPARRAAAATEFDFLFDPNVTALLDGLPGEQPPPRPDCYDLLASEARLTSFLAIAKGDVPLALVPARPSAHADPRRLGARLVVGSMFEYLMPSSCSALPGEPPRPRPPPSSCGGKSSPARTGRPVGRLRVGLLRPGPQAHLPVLRVRGPGLGLKRGLVEDLVIAPYATALAAMVDPGGGAEPRPAREARCASPFGYYEAVDYTAERLTRGRTERASCRPTWPTTRG